VIHFTPISSGGMVNMEINPNDNTINIGAYVKNINDGQKAENTSEKTETKGAKSDTVSISDAAKEIQEVRKKLDDIPEVRAEKIAELKDRIENRTYEIKPEETAEKMIRDALLNDLF
jgi:negative regulator of flagellin synthesis FlgM